MTLNHYRAGGCLIVSLGGLFVLWIAQSHFGAGTGFYNNVLRDKGPVEFESAKWFANPEPKFSVPLRYRMAKWLVKERRLVGLEYAEIESMLGPPTDRYSIGYTLNEVEAILGRPTDRVPLVLPRREYPAWRLMAAGSHQVLLVVRVGVDGRVESAEVLGG